MEIPKHSTSTPWSENTTLPNWPRLIEDRHCDVCVIGAGFAGLNTAYLLAKAGLSVCVVESLNMGEGQSAQTTAHVTAVLDARYFELIESLGVESARSVLISHLEAMAQIEETINNEGIDCDLSRVDGHLCASHRSKEVEILDKELLALQQMDWPGIQRMTRAPLYTFTTGPCLRFPDQLQMHPLKYMRSMAEILVARGCPIFCHTQVREVKSEQGGIKVLTALGYTITAQSVVVASNTPIHNPVAVHTKQAPYRTYAMSYKIPRESVKPGLYWDLESPYHYLRTQKFTDTHDLLIIGGEDHKTGQNDHPQASFDRLANWATDRFSFLDEIVHRWSGQVIETIDGLPFLGHSPLANKNIYVITGHSGVGVVESMLGASVVSDQILRGSSPWEKLYSPSRFSIRDIGEYVRENANVAAQYSDWLVPQSEESVNDLAEDSGMVVNHGLKKVAVYKTKTGELEYFSAACPHLGGVVHWNETERSWDCPCHGSRFDCHGRVIEGPAVKDLQPVSDTWEVLPIPEQEIPLNP